MEKQSAEEEERVVCAHMRGHAHVFTHTRMHSARICSQAVMLLDLHRALADNPYVINLYCQHTVKEWQDSLINYREGISSSLRKTS